MKKCPCCQITFTDEAETCPKCQCMLAEYTPEEAEMLTDSFKAKRRRDWIWIFVGVPAMLLIIYGAYWILQRLWR